RLDRARADRARRPPPARNLGTPRALARRLRRHLAERTRAIRRPALRASRRSRLRPLRLVRATRPALIVRWAAALAGAAYVGYVVVRWHDLDRKSTRLNSSHVAISYAVFCLKKKKKKKKSRLNIKEG